jgi:hypothetical protein
MKSYFSLHFSAIIFIDYCFSRLHYYLPILRENGNYHLFHHIIFRKSYPSSYTDDHHHYYYAQISFLIFDPFYHHNEFVEMYLWTSC